MSRPSDQSKVAVERFCRRKERKMQEFCYRGRGRGGGSGARSGCCRWSVCEFDSFRLWLGCRYPLRVRRTIGDERGLPMCLLGKGAV